MSQLSTTVLSFWVIFSTTAQADSYDYEIGISYDSTQGSNDSVANFGISPIPATVVTINSDSDTDEITASGNWYFDGVIANDGPRTRAAFIGRASYLSLTYTNGRGDDVITINSSDPLIPSSTFQFDRENDDFSAGLRWVWAESGWYGLANIVSADFDFSGDSGSVSTSADIYGVGVGKYIGTQTTIDLTVVRVESDSSGNIIGGNSSSSEVALSFSHIGNLGQTWQYGTDIGLSTTNVGNSDGSFNIGLSIYPTRDIAFGLNVISGLRDADAAPKRYNVSGSWFSSEKLEFTAGYGWVDIDEPPNTNSDQSSFSVGANYRF